MNVKTESDCSKLMAQKWLYSAVTIQILLRFWQIWIYHRASVLRICTEREKQTLWTAKLMWDSLRILSFNFIPMMKETFMWWWEVMENTLTCAKRQVRSVTTLNSEAEWGRHFSIMSRIFANTDSVKWFVKNDKFIPLKTL